MTRIMVWNVREFGDRFFQGNAFAQMRRDLLHSLTAHGGAAPDVFFCGYWDTFARHPSLSPRSDVTVSLKEINEDVNHIIQNARHWNVERLVKNFKYDKKHKKSAERFISGQVFDYVIKQCKLTNDSSLVDFFDGLMKSIPVRPRFNISFEALRDSIADEICKYAKGAKGGTYTQADQATYVSRAATLLNHIMSANILQANLTATVETIRPDILVVLEVCDHQAVTRYTPLAHPGGEGAVLLLDLLRTREAFRTFCLIPPVRLGGALKDCEGIAVYYDSEKLAFTGPWWWNPTGAIDPTTTGAIPGQYGFPYMPPQIDPDGEPVKPGYCLPTRAGLVPPVLECQLAGQCKFNDNRGNALAFCWLNARTPLLVDFQDLAAGRAIKLLATHTNRGVGGVSNPAGVSNLGSIVEMTTTLNASVGFITGDFNCDACNSTDIKAYDPLTNNGYKLLIDGTQAQALTHLNNDIKKSFSVDFPTLFARQFPCYSYMDLALQNALVRNSTGIPFIINQLTGTAWAHGTAFGYGAKFETPGTAEGVASLLIPRDLDVVNKNLTDLTKINDDVVKSNILATLKTMHALSDHLPVVVDF